MAGLGSPLEELLLIIGLAAGAAQAFPDPAVDAGAVVASKLIAIIQAANAAHQSVTGKAIDPDVLQPIDPIP